MKNYKNFQDFLEKEANLLVSSFPGFFEDAVSIIQNFYLEKSITIA